MTSELTILPSRSLGEYFVRYSLGYYPTRTMQWEASARTRFSYGTILESGLLYSRGLPGVLTWNNRLGLYVTPSWRVDTVLNAYIPDGSGNRLAGWKMIQSEFIVRRNLHCWEAQFIFRNRPPFTREYAIQLNLRMGAAEEKQKLEDRELEGQFYPWRYRE